MKIIHGSFKPHLVLENSIVPKLAESLKDEFGNSYVSDSVIFVENGTSIWEPGGTLIGKDLRFSFKLSPEFTLECRSQHWYKFKRVIRESVLKDKVYKVDSQMYCLCLTEEQMSNLVRQILKNNEKFDQICAVTLEREL